MIGSHSTQPISNPNPLMHTTTLKHNLLLISLFTISFAQHGISQPNICSESAVESLYQTYAYPPRDPSIEISGKILFPKHEDPKYVLTFYFSSVLFNTTGNSNRLFNSNRLST